LFATASKTAWLLLVVARHREGRGGMTTFPIAQGTKLQGLLDEGDEHFFATHPSAVERRRFYFRGERVDDHRTPSRYVIVSLDADGRLERRFEQEGGGA